MTYDSQGNKLTETNQVNQTRSFEYDDQNRLKAVVLPSVLDPSSSTMKNPRYEYGYDERGNQTFLVDPLGRETRWKFDSNGRQIERQLPLGFGADGKLTGSETANSTFIEKTKYDIKERVDYTISFEGIVTKNVYREAGTYADGRLVAQLFYDSLASYLVSPETPTETWTFTYDAFGREKSITRTNAGSGATLTVVNEYDQQGRLVSIQSPEGIVSYAFNDLGRMTATMVGLASQVKASKKKRRKSNQESDFGVSCYKVAYLSIRATQRRARDSNPQPLTGHFISNEAASHSLTLQGSQRIARS